MLEPAPPAEPLDEAGAVHRALVRDRGIAGLAGEELLEQLRGLDDTAARPAQLRWRQGWGESETKVLGLETSAGESELTRVGLRIYPRNPWSLRAATLRYDARHNAVSAELQEAILQLEIQVRRLFLQIETGKAILALQEAQLKVSARYRDQVRRRMEADVSTLVEAIDASSDYLRALGRRNEMQRAVSGVRMELARRVGCAPEQLEIGAAVELPPVAMWQSLSADGLADESFQRRGAYQQLAWRRRAQEYALSAAKWERLPWFAHLQASYAWATSEDQDAPDFGAPFAPPLETTEGDEWRVDAAVALPVSAWWGADIRLRGRELTRLRQDEQMFRERLQSELAAALGRVEAAHGTWQAYEADAVHVRQSLKDALASLRSQPVGNGGDELAAERALLQSEQESLALRLRYALCVLDLEALTGRPLEMLAREGEGEMQEAGIPEVEGDDD